MLLRITDADKAKAIAGRPFQEGQLTRLEPDATKALIEAGCAEVHEIRLPVDEEVAKASQEALERMDREIAAVQPKRGRKAKA